MTKNFNLFFINYLNPTAACQTKANNKKKTGIIGNISTMGLNATYASGNRASNKLSIMKTSVYNIEYIKFNNINFTLKIWKNLIYLKYVYFQNQPTF